MLQEDIDLINKVVWFIPFKNKRNAVRNFLLRLIENQNDIKKKLDSINNIDTIDTINDLKNIQYLYYSCKLKNIKPNIKKILFITHDYSITGAPLAVFNTAKALKEKGYEVKVIGFNGGALLEQYNTYNIETFIIKDFLNIETSLLNLIYYFDFVFANTVASCNFINKINGKIPYLWRVSEGKDIKSFYINKFKNLEYILSKVDTIYAVSEYTKNVLLTYNKNVNLLLYGIKDISFNYSKHKIDNNKIKFCCIGTYCERKGQDIIFKALKLLSNDILNKLEVIFIGDLFPQNICNNNSVKYLGIKIDQEKYEILSKCDILLHPALDDPNPQVVMEGMMMSKPCIITDQVGQKEYITNGENGFILEAGNIKQLSDLMTYIVNNSQILEEIGNKSYQIYKKYFDFDNYISNVISIIEKGMQND